MTIPTVEKTKVEKIISLSIKGTDTGIDHDNTIPLPIRATMDARYFNGSFAGRLFSK
jgi:hypothetical protein